jgi:hypothetical protein
VTTAHRRLATLVIGLLIVAAIVTLVRTPNLRDWVYRRPVAVTELYFADPVNLPLSAKVNQAVSFTFIIENHFTTARTYTWKVTSTTTSGSGISPAPVPAATESTVLPVAVRTIAMSSVTLKPVQVWSQRESVVATGPGVLQVTVALQTGQHIDFKVAVTR